MNNTHFNLIGVFLASLLLAAGTILPGAAEETYGQSASSKEEGPALSPLLSAQEEDQQNKAAENNNQPEAPQVGEEKESNALAPQMDSASESPDAPAKVNVEGPVEEKPLVEKAEEQQQPATEEKTTTSTEMPGGEKPGAGAAVEPEQAVPPPPPTPKRELTPALAALRDQVRRTLAVYEKIPFNTRQNTAGEIIEYCLPLGCGAEITLYDSGGAKRANGIACLCWNYPCGGYEPLTVSDGRIAARLGYGTQSRPSQLLAMLAFARVPTTYPLRVGDTVRTVADLVESEKRSCRSGADLSLQLIGLGYYADEGTWQNDLREEWSLEKIIQKELDQPVVTAANGGLDRLLGLSYVACRRNKRNLPLEGQYARAEKYVGDFQNYAFSLQNADGSWGYFLSGKGANRDAAAGLRSSGYVLQWLALAVPEERLDDKRLAAGIGYLNNMLNNQQYLSNLPALATRDIAGAVHAMHALAIYDERLFKPADSQQAPAEQNPAPATAKRDSGGSL